MYAQMHGIILIQRNHITSDGLFMTPGFFSEPVHMCVSACVFDPKGTEHLSFILRS